MISSPPSPRRGLRVLVVEDNPVIQRLLTLLVATTGGNAQTVDNGEEALAHLQKSRWDLVLMDLHLPGPDGLTISRMARALGNTDPIILVTADPDGARAAHSSPHIDGWLDKPLNPRDLHSLFQRTAKRTPEQSHNIVCL